MARRARVRGDLSGPIIAILITVVAVAAGLVAGMWFLRSGSQMSKTSMLTVVGQPTLVPANDGTYAYVTLKNIGTETVTVDKLVIRVGDKKLDLNPSSTIEIEPGQSVSAEFSTTTTITITNSTVTGTIITDHGTVPVVLYVISNAAGNVASSSGTTASSSPA